MAARLETYRTFRERFGKLVLGAIGKSTPGELMATLMDSDGAPHEFIFTVQTEPPGKPVSIALRENVPGGHFGFHH